MMLDIRASFRPTSSTVSASKQNYTKDLCFIKLSNYALKNHVPTIGERPHELLGPDRELHAQTVMSINYRTLPSRLVSCC